MPYDKDVNVAINTPGHFDELHHAKMGNGRSDKVRQTQISVQCTNLAEQSEILSKLIHELEERLNIVLRPTNDERSPFNPGEELQSEPLAPHADFLQARVNWLRKVGDHLASIIQRIEL